MSGIDAVIIGAGHNGLVCAATLARARKRVVVLESANEVGGAAVTREFAPGYRVSACAHLLHQMPESLVKELDLAAHGLQFAATAIPTIALSSAGAHIWLGQDRGSAGLPPQDAAAYAAFTARMARFAAHLRPALQAAPPRLGTDNWADRAALLKLAWQVRSLGRTDMRELLRIIGMNVYDLVEEHFTTPELRGAVAFDAVLGSNFGPRAPGTVLTLMCRLIAESVAGPAQMAQPRGGMGALTQALAGAARAAGATIRTGTRVAGIVVQNDRAAGVVLESGERIDAAQVISNADPTTTFLKLLGAAHLDTGFVRRLSHYRHKGLAAKLHLALSGPPVFTGLDADGLAGRLLIAPSPDYIENAFNPVKYGECSTAPAMEISVPSASDSSLAPAGAHVLSAIVQYAPYAPRGGWDAARPAFLENCIATLERYAPGLRALITHAELLTPADIEASFGIAGGHWHHGDLAFDQFFMVRPVPGAAHYRAPLGGLYLCGAGAHPGGGVMGVAGCNAAREVLRDAS